MDISYRQGIRSKGFAITAATGITQQTLSLSGLAKSFEGFLLSSAFTATPQTIIDPAQLRITLTINNDVVVDDDLGCVLCSYCYGRIYWRIPFLHSYSASFDWTRHDPASHHE
jgi:2-keto-4-pentenoate hydratase/2-oxohepta-3-ene-1,7-dioic acid hydratase in catechol pathway